MIYRKKIKQAFRSKFNSIHNEIKSKNRETSRNIIECVIFLAKQGLAFRVHDESEASINQGCQHFSTIICTHKVYTFFVAILYTILPYGVHNGSPSINIGIFFGAFKIKKQRLGIIKKISFLKLRYLEFFKNGIKSEFKAHERFLVGQAYDVASNMNGICKGFQSIFSFFKTIFNQKRLKRADAPLIKKNLLPQLFWLATPLNKTKIISPKY